MARKKVGKCYCGGTIYRYAGTGFLGETIKCDRCGGGETFDWQKDHEKEIKQVIKALKSEEGY